MLIVSAGAGLSSSSVCAISSALFCMSSGRSVRRRDRLVAEILLRGAGPIVGYVTGVGATVFVSFGVFDGTRARFSGGRRGGGGGGGDGGGGLGNAK